MQVIVAIVIGVAFGHFLPTDAVTMLTSKGSTGVTGAGFITLAASLSVVPTVPVTAMVLILGIDRFMSECRALTNTMGNGVASIVIAAWEKELDRDRLRAALARPAGAGSVSEASATEGGAMAAAVREGDARRSI